MREFRVNWYRVFSRWVGLVLAVDRLAGLLLLKLFLLEWLKLFLLEFVKRRWGERSTMMEAHRILVVLIACGLSRRARFVTTMSGHQTAATGSLARRGLGFGFGSGQRCFLRGPGSCLSIFCLYLGRALLRRSLLCFRVGFAA